MPLAEQNAAVHEMWPLLSVADITRSIAFYRDQLGFSVVSNAKDNGRVFWCRLKRGGASICFGWSRSFGTSSKTHCRHVLTPSTFGFLVSRRFSPESRLCEFPCETMVPASIVARDGRSLRPFLRRSPEGPGWGCPS